MVETQSFLISFSFYIYIYTLLPSFLSNQSQLLVLSFTGTLSSERFRDIKMCSKSNSQATGKDRISELPDAVLCHILSFVPTKYSVRTSILSTRWKSICGSVPNLDFEFEQMSTTWKEEYMSNYVGFLMFVDWILSLRDSLDIQKFRLHCYCRVEDFSRIVGWICTAIRHNVVELDLCVYSDNVVCPTFELPQCVFMSKTLVVLKVKSNCITYAPPTSGCFPSLKFLDVKVDYPEDDSVGELFACCPVLEDLSIDATIRDALILSFKVSVPELKRLRMTFFSDMIVGKDFMYDISINAPKLENLDIKQDSLSVYLFENLNSLVKGSVDLYYHHGQFWDDEVSERATVLLEAFSNVKCLSISAHFVEERCLPAFDHLTELKLVLYDCYRWDLLTELLKKSPNLESLVIEHKKDEECVKNYDETESYSKDVLYSEHRWSTPESVPICLISHLKTITVRGFEGYPHVKKVAKYLLNNGGVLTKMTVYNDELYKELMLERGSRTCWVELV
ncbi:LOW QUALITY PROTEIN: F-box/LRR-repeat protein At4g14103 [Pyrus x bretschneideri]|uniref:LOW QUALITY PROTEIN: F-box/LRR-repeat protein At4g14103 n=1 Tax=Pyrus x bretschneideri TaxID=225117 RepID=UPI00203003D8|nr:LOW QUALITY PROTEIN: F-box/LRR-repeat protein At4g14103 [Pyrus x bretschneideri]